MILKKTIFSLRMEDVRLHVTIFIHVLFGTFSVLAGYKNVSCSIFIPNIFKLKKASLKCCGVFQQIRRYDDQSLFPIQERFNFCSKSPLSYLRHEIKYEVNKILIFIRIPRKI